MQGTLDSKLFVVILHQGNDARYSLAWGLFTLWNKEAFKYRLIKSRYLEGWGIHVGWGKVNVGPVKPEKQKNWDKVAS